MKITVAALSLVAVAGQATALSCLGPDPITTFNRVAAEADDYFVLYGQLTFDEDALPPAVSDKPMSSAGPAPISAFFQGKGLTPDGFTSDFISPATLMISCAGPWCGSANSGVDAVYFVRADHEPVQMLATPCGGMIFEKPAPDVLAALTSCMQGGACSPQPFEQLK